VGYTIVKSIKYIYPAVIALNIVIEVPDKQKLHSANSTNDITLFWYPLYGLLQLFCGIKSILMQRLKI